MMEIVTSLEKLPDAATHFWNTVKTSTIFAFYGGMGAGKTTFITELCRWKKVSGHVSSPTFSIINEYSHPGGIIYHIDLYRLKDETEAVNAGVEDVLNSGSICFIEWPEVAPGILPEGTVKIDMEVLDRNDRKITIYMNS